MVRRALRALLAVTFGVCAALLAVRAIWGTSRLIHSPVNVEGIASLAFLLLAALGVCGSLPAPAALRTRDPRAPLLVAAVTFLVFLPSLTIPFVADDSYHIWNARHVTWQSALAHFTQPEKDRFFRPVVYLAYAAEAPFAGLNPAMWHALSLTWHVVNTVLVYLLLRRFRMDVWPAAVGALLFAVHGTRPEAVTWISARFDVMATGFSLAALLVLVGKAPNVSRARYAWSLLLLLLAVLCKESALVLPLLAAASLLYLQLPRARVLRLSGGWLALTLSLFVYRFFLIGGIGGYANASDGRPSVFNLRWATTLKGLFLRAWGATLFPINWTHAPEWWVTVPLCLSLAALLWLAIETGPRPTFLLGLAFFFVSALPVHQFLSIGEDLEKSRVLYLPSVGFAILMAGLFTGRRDRHARVKVTAACALIGFQAAALSHNLLEWRRVGDLAQATCQAITARVDRGMTPLSVPNLPNTVDGVYFLRTGFPQCVWLARPSHAQDVTVNPLPDVTVLHWVLHWDDTRRVVSP